MTLEGDGTTSDGDGHEVAHGDSLKTTDGKHDAAHGVTTFMTDLYQFGFWKFSDCKLRECFFLTPRFG